VRSLSIFFHYLLLSTNYLLLSTNSMAFHLGVQKNPKIILLVFVISILTIVAFALANQCGFFECVSPPKQPSN
jgi:ABC-type Fe3+-siderophore transport system permease subunit